MNRIQVSKHKPSEKVSGNAIGKKKEVEEFTIPIAIQTQPIKAPPPPLSSATNPNVLDRRDALGHLTSNKSSENERDPSPTTGFI